MSIGVKEPTNDLEILVLGDSSSSGIGLGRSVYPYRLYTKLKDRCSVRIENHAVPGFTSSDAARYYCRTLSDRRWDYIIIYLGNNEGSRSRYKGSYRPGLDGIFGRLRVAKRKRYPPHQIPLREKFVFSRDGDAQARTIANTPGDFRNNLHTIVSCAAKRRAKVVLINPIANKHFPAGLGATNFPFYKILGIPSELGPLLVPRDEETRRLVQAIMAHEARAWTVAGEGYRSLLDSHDSISFVARNNLAVLLSETGDVQAATSMLNNLLSIDHPDSAIAAYNLSRVHAQLGREAESVAFRDIARETDATLYRVKEAYREAVAAIGADPDVCLIDLESVLGEDNFVDYCHPDEAGHEKIASCIAAYVLRSQVKTQATCGSEYRQECPSPDAYADIAATLLDYYSIDCDVRSEDVVEEVHALIRRARQEHLTDLASESTTRLTASSTIGKNIVKTFEYAIEHPVISDIDDLESFEVRYSHEILNFPEYYVYRILWNYFSYCEAHDCRPGSRSEYSGKEWVLASADYKRIILSHRPFEMELTLNFSVDYYSRIMTRIRQRLRTSVDLFRNGASERLHTTMYWYTREAFRYGTQSRVSMLFPLWEIQKMLEGLTVCSAIAHQNKQSDLQRPVAELSAGLLDLAGTHEHFAQQFVRNRYSVGDEYQKALDILSSSLVAFSAR